MGLQLFSKGRRQKMSSYYSSRWRKQRSSVGTGLMHNLQLLIRKLFPKSDKVNRRDTCLRQGVVGRAVDLTMLRGYDQLIDELEEMSEIKRQLHPCDKWEIVYTDDGGDMMLVGDFPWQEFCNMVRRIFICSSQDGEGTVISSDSTEN